MRNEALIDMHIRQLRALGCAVIVITAEDIQCLTEEGENDESPYTIEQIDLWMRLYWDEVEEAILGDYWGDTIRDVIAHRPITGDKHGNRS